jgi:hypothetical protein
METSTKRNPRLSGAIRTIVVALALTTALGGMSTAIARGDGDGDDRGHEDRGRHDQRWHRERHGEGEYRGYVYERPRNYYYAPPPVDYYRPPPPSPAIEFVFPLHFR